MSAYEIIRRVRDHPEIWKFSHPLHKTRKAHTLFWRKLAAEIETSEATVRRKWKHLLDQYRKEAKKAMKKNLPDEVVCWEYYQPLSFLKREIMLREKERAGGFLNGYFTDTETECNDESVAGAMPEPTEVVQPQATQNTEECPCYIDISPKVKLILERVTETKEFVEQNNKSIDDKTRNDPDYMYLMSLLPYMKQLTEVERLQFRGVANDWLLKTLSNKNQTILNEPDIEYDIIDPEVKEENTIQ